MLQLKKAISEGCTMLTSAFRELEKRALSMPSYHCLIISPRSTLAIFSSVFYRQSYFAYSGGVHVIISCAPFFLDEFPYTIKESFYSVAAA
jgi:hypothetical protein